MKASMSTTVTGALEEAIRFTVPWTAAVAVVVPEGARPPVLDRRKVFSIPAAGDARDDAATFERVESLRAEGCEYLIVPASLLDWLDGVVYEPEADGDRVFGTYENAVAAIHILPEDVRDRVFIKSFPYRGGSGTAGAPARHPDFALRPFWKCEFWMPSQTISRCGTQSASGNSPP